MCARGWPPVGVPVDERWRDGAGWRQSEGVRFVDVAMRELRMLSEGEIVEATKAIADLVLRLDVIVTRIEQTLRRVEHSAGVRRGSPDDRGGSRSSRAGPASDRIASRVNQVVP